jgi:RNA polymerase sigma-70 factor (ECF subfamily)
LVLPSSDERLSQISTLWTQLRRAHGDSPSEITSAQQTLMDRYCGAVYRYLLGATRDEDAALDLFQDFAVRLLRGDFRRADPVRGRFRDYVKTALIHLVSDDRREQRTRPMLLPMDAANVIDATWDDDVEFTKSWREELIDRAWKALAEAHPLHHAALMLHAEDPDLSSAEIAQRLAERFEKPMSMGNVRVILHRAREKFAALLVQEVAQTLDGSSREELRRELQELQLLELCQEALERRRS